MEFKLVVENNFGAFFLKKSLEDFDMFKRVVSIFSHSFLKSEYHLTDREIELLYCIVQFKKNGSGDIYSKTNIKEYFAPFKNKRIMQVWLPKLEDKDWITYTKNTIDFKRDQVLKFLSKDSINFNLNLKTK